jgi:hypothetical protein
MERPTYGAHRKFSLFNIPYTQYMLYQRMPCFCLVFGQYYLASYLPRQHALAAYWLKKIANSTPEYMILDQSYAAHSAQDR